MNSNDHIRKLYLKYLDESITLTEQEILFNFFASATETAIENVIGEYLENGEVPNDLSFLDANTTKIFEKIKDSVGMAPAQEPTVKPKIPIYNTVLFKTAAILTIVLGIVAYLLMYNKPIVILTVSAPYGTIKQFTFSDSSKVWLNAGTVIEYPERFDRDTRRITLKNGQAFFEIKHDKNHPFIIHAEKTDITVLGTSFDVNLLKEQMLVTVATGKVGIAPEQGKQSVHVVPGEQAIYHNQSGNFTKATVNLKEVTAWKNSRFIFSDAGFAEVIKVLEEKYNVDIQVKNNDLLSETISIRLGDEPLENVLSVLSFSNNFKYTINGRKVIIE